MKRQMVVLIASAVCVLGLASAAQVARGQEAQVEARWDQANDHRDNRDRGCTNASLRGAYGFFRTGTTASGVLAAVGRATYDGHGFFTVTQTTVRNGVAGPGDFDGVYEVNPDCTGTWSLLNGQVIAYFVLVDGANEGFFLSTSPGNTVAGSFKRITRGGGRH
jgi:hypothetical protein